MATWITLKVYSILGFTFGSISIHMLWGFFVCFFLILALAIKLIHNYNMHNKFMLMLKYLQNSYYLFFFNPHSSLLIRPDFGCTEIVYTYWLGMRVIALLLSSRYQLFSEATWRKIVGTKGTIKVLLPEYQVY